MAQVPEETGLPDIVIDDGGHTGVQQINSFEALYPAMKIPGLPRGGHLHLVLGRPLR